MRASVAQRGVAGSTFDHVARDAGVSRGLLHYYFGCKERLLAEVVRRDAELRLGLLDRRLADAADADGVMRAMVVSFHSALISLVRSVSTRPGATEFTFIPNGAAYRASDFVKPMMPALAAV